MASFYARASLAMPFTVIVVAAAAAAAVVVVDVVTVAVFAHVMPVFAECCYTIPVSFRWMHHNCTNDSVWHAENGNCSEEYTDQAKKEWQVPTLSLILAYLPCTTSS